MYKEVVENKCTPWVCLLPRNPLIAQPTCVRSFGFLANCHLLWRTRLHNQVYQFVRIDESQRDEMYLGALLRRFAQVRRRWLCVLIALKSAGMRLFALLMIGLGLARLARSSVVRFWGFGNVSFGLRCFLWGILCLRRLSDHGVKRRAGIDVQQPG